MAVNKSTVSPGCRFTASRRQLYGQPVDLNFEFPISLPKATGTPVLSIVKAETGARDKLPAKEIYRSHRALPDGSPTLIVSRRPDGDQLHYPGLAQFLVAVDRISVHPVANADPDLLTGRLLGPVMAYWLESRSTTVFHASAVVTSAGSMAFLSHNGGGKSTLAVAMMRHGHALLTDDMLAVVPEGGRITAYPSYPEVRMWPDMAELFLDDPQCCRPVHPDSSKLRVPVRASTVGGFCTSPVSLRGLYLPCRQTRNKAPAIQTVSPAQAAKMLIRHSFIPHLAGLVRDPGERLDAIVRIADELPLKKILFTDDVQQLDHVCELLLEDIGASSSDGMVPGSGQTDDSPRARSGPY